MTRFEFTHAERAGWQQQAARELAAILHAHPDLPIIAWTLASAGSVLAGQVSGPAPSDQLRRAFDAWHAALRLCPPREVVLRDGTIFVKATTCRNHVRVTLTATLGHNENAEVTP